jgi:hypothetical protein
MGLDPHSSASVVPRLGFGDEVAELDVHGLAARPARIGVSQSEDEVAPANPPSGVCIRWHDRVDWLVKLDDGGVPRFAAGNEGDDRAPVLGAGLLPPRAAAEPVRPG